ncbi:MAG: hypothetical protein HRT44_06600 [Bdellovibrionales bacterium]|nr:hypothetical protein [Bdellovibrionales bacterium]
MMIIGDQEMEENKVSVRMRTGEMSAKMELSEFIRTVTEEVKTKSLSPYVKAEASN